MSFTYNGINCETFGMMVEHYPSRVFPTRKCSIYSVTGRSGDLIVDEDAYTNVTVSYDVFVKGDLAGLQARLTSIGAWLLGTAGYARLEDSYDTTVYRMGRVANAVEFLNSLNQFGRATLQFDCMPQRFPMTDEVLSVVFADILETLTYPSNGLLPAYPVIEITGKQLNATARIVAGDLQVTIATPAAINRIVIDFSTQSVYNAFNNQRPLLTSVLGNWRKLGAGDTITARNESNESNMTLTVYTKRYTI